MYMNGNKPDVLTLTKASEILGVNYRTVWRWVNTGKLESVRFPSGQIRVYREDIERMVKREAKQSN
jgi:excisionase family DNA binding protein